MGRALPLLAIVILTVATFSGSFNGEFVSDDIGNIRDNTSIRSLDRAHLKETFTSFNGPNYLPLTMLSFAVDYQIWGLEPFGYHLTNLLIHILCVILLYRILIRLEMDTVAALLVALVWAIHPLQVESVAWISERKNVLSTFFLLAGFRTYLGFSEHRRPVAYLGLLVLYILAILSKMTAMVLPGLCLAYELAFRFRIRGRDWLASLPMFALAVAVGWFNLAGNPVHALGYHGGSALVTGFTSSVVVLQYLKQVLLPIDLMVHYDVLLRGSLLDPIPLLAVLCLLGIILGTLWCIRRRARPGFWVLWFFITLSPMLNLIPFAALRQDRYMYLPLVGPLVLIALGLETAVRKGMPRYAGAGFAALVIVGCAVLSVQRVGVYDSPLAHWKDWALRMPYSPSEGYHRPPDFGAKVRLLEAAIQRDPGAAAPLATLGALHYEAGAIRLAVEKLEAAREIEPDHRRILMNLGRAYARAGRYDVGEPMIARAVALEPHSLLAQRHLARVRLDMGDLDGARSAMAALERICPADSRAGYVWEDLHRRLEQVEAGSP